MTNHNLPEAAQQMPNLGDLTYTFMLNASMVTKPDDTFTKQVHQLNEEFAELRTALAQKDFVEVWDGIGDVIFVITSLEILHNMSTQPTVEETLIYRQAYADLTVLMAQHELPTYLCEIAGLIAAESNLTKFDDTEEDAKVTQAHYLENFGIKTVIHFVEETGSYVVKADGAQKTDKMEVHDGKCLKSVKHFRKPDFTRLAAENEPSYALKGFVHEG